MATPATLPPMVISTPISKNGEGQKKFLYFYQRDDLNPLLKTKRNEVITGRLRYREKFMAAALKIGFKSPEEAMPFFIKVWNLLEDLDAEKITFNSTPDDTVSVRADINTHTLYLEFYLDVELPQGYEVVISLYQSRQHKLSASGSFEYVIKHLNTYFEKLESPSKIAIVA